MKINSSTLGMDSARSYKAVSMSYRRYELRDYSNVYSGLTGSRGNAPAETDNSSEIKNSKKNETVGAGDSVSSGTFMPVGLLSSGVFMSTDEVMSLREKMTQVRNDYKVRTQSSNDYETIRQESIKYIFDLLFGRAHERIRKWLEEHMSPSVGRGTGIGTYNVDNSSGDVASNVGNVTGNGSVNVNTGNMQVYNYEHAEYRYESEDTTFSARGVVKTADGREIPFNIDVAMSREFESYYEEKSQLNVKSNNGVAKYVAMCDPLVINLNSNIASVSDQKIRFDIDGDGEIDTINRLAQGSGYLALDKNNDGKINDGTELFGTASGDGFADLAEYDDDGNGWIDESDDVWNKLKVMTYDESGKECLYSLEQTGVGAICLSRLSTDFSQKDEDNNTQSAIRSTGIFLYENGAVGTVQHLDVAKYRQDA